MVAKPMVALRLNTMAPVSEAEAQRLRFGAPPLGPPAGLIAGGGQRRLQLLTQAVETEVVPRLLLAQSGLRPQPPPGFVVTLEEVDGLVGLLLSRDTEPAAAHLLALASRGVPVEKLYLDLMAPAARRLGELWLLDRCHVADVTLGLWRLQQVLHDLSPGFLHECGICPGDCRRALIACIQGEQHTFGLSMVGEFLRRAGWEVLDEQPSTATELAALVRHSWFAMVGLSISSEERLDALAAAIRAIRRASRNPAIGVMVGGTLFMEHPDFVLRVGADATAADARQAVLQAEALLRLLVEPAQSRAGCTAS